MIDKTEIDDQAGALGVHPSHVQRDYVFGWLLSGLFQPTNPLATTLSLKGGNAFRKAYFENARYSNDLDFSAPVDVSEDAIRTAISDACAVAGPRSGVEFLPTATRVRFRESVDEEGRLYEARVYFRSFYGEEEATLKVKLDIKEFDQVILPIALRPLIHSYSDAGECAATIRCHKLEELLASKLVALLYRVYSPDLFDFVHSVFFQNALAVNRLEIITTFLRKSIYAPMPLTARGLLLDLPFAALRGFWKEYLVCPAVSMMSFDDAADRFKNGIGDLFGLLAPTKAPAIAASANATFYSGGVRAAIMEAAQLQHLLRLVYDGYERVVEPYALAFKRRKDGVAQEYFYAYDRSGGSSGKVGIKSFFPNKVHSVRVEAQAFEPRYPIELVKGTSVGEFSRPTFARPSRAQPVRSRPFSVTHTIECPLCGKQFKRDRITTLLNAHKNRFGSACAGRRGFLVN